MKWPVFLNFTHRIALWEIKERISYIVLVLSMSFLYVPWHCTFTMPALSRWVCVMYDILISRFLGTYTRQKRFEFATAHKHASFLLPFPLMYIFFQSTSVNTQIFILYCKNFFTLFDTCNNVCCIHVKKAKHRRPVSSVENIGSEKLIFYSVKTCWVAGFFFNHCARGGGNRMKPYF